MKNLAQTRPLPRTSFTRLVGSPRAVIWKPAWGSHTPAWGGVFARTCPTRALPPIQAPHTLLFISSGRTPTEACYCQGGDTPPPPFLALAGVAHDGATAASIPLIRPGALSRTYVPCPLGMTWLHGRSRSRSLKVRHPVHLPLQPCLATALVRGLTPPAGNRTPCRFGLASHVDVEHRLY